MFIRIIPGITTIVTAIVTNPIVRQAVEEVVVDFALKGIKRFKTQVA